MKRTVVQDSFLGMVVTVADGLCGTSIQSCSNFEDYGIAIREYRTLISAIVNTVHEGASRMSCRHFHRECATSAEAEIERARRLKMGGMVEVLIWEVACSWWYLVCEVL